MQKICSSREAYYNGLDSLRNQDNVKARYWFEMAYKNPKFKDSSLSKLMQINLREGKYAKVRKMLEDNHENNSIKLKQVYGLLENIENNFEASKQYYSQCMVDPDMQNKSLLAIAKLYIQTGDNEVARKMLETLQLNKKFNVQSIISLICLNILEQNYTDAYKLLKTIDQYQLTPKLNQHYKILNIYLLYFLGKLNMSQNNFDPVREYMAYRLFDSSDETLIRHIQRHNNQREKATNGCFFKHMNFKKLLYDVRNQMEIMNPNHFELSDMYRFRLDTPIGFKGEEITSDICVSTMIGTKDIITMYPVLLSDQFDKEGMSTSKQLMLKRSQGGKKYDK